MRRAAGEGSIYPVKSGGFKATVEVPTPNGKRVRRSVKGATRREVGDKLIRLRAQVADGTLTLGPEMTVEAWLAHWLDSVAVLRTSTRVGYASKIKVRIVPYVGKVRVDRLQPEHLEQLYATLIGEGLSPATVTQVHRILHRALRVAEQRRRVPRNVASLVSPPKARHREAVALTREQAVKVLEVASTRRSAVRWQVALAMGLRQGEALGLTWAGVDLAAGTLAVTTELVWIPYAHGCGGTCGTTARRCVNPVRTAGRYVLEEPKSARSRRVLPLPSQLVEALRAWRKVQLEERLALGEKWRGFTYRPAGRIDDVSVELVFAQPNGLPTGGRADWGDWQEILDEAGVPRMGTHGGRHTTATLMLEAGEDTRVVMEWLGHSTIALTANTYQHVAMKLKRGAAESVGAALWGKG